MTHLGVIRTCGTSLSITQLRLVRGRLEITARGVGPALIQTGAAELIGEDGELVYQLNDFVVDDPEPTGRRDTITLVLPIWLQDGSGSR